MDLCRLCSFFMLAGGPRGLSFVLCAPRDGVNVISCVSSTKGIFELSYPFSTNVVPVHASSLCLFMNCSMHFPCRKGGKRKKEIMSNRCVISVTGNAARYLTCCCICSRFHLRPWVEVFCTANKQNRKIFF